MAHSKRSPIQPMPFPGESPTVSLAMAAARMYAPANAEEKPARASKAKRRTSKSTPKPTRKSSKPSSRKSTKRASGRSRAR